MLPLHQRINGTRSTSSMHGAGPHAPARAASAIKAVVANSTPRRASVLCNVAAVEQAVGAPIINSSVHTIASECEQPAMEVEHPGLPYIPAFRVGDVVYGSVSFHNQKGARADIMYHEGLTGFMPVDQSPLTTEEWVQNSARLFNKKPPPGRHAHGVPLHNDTGMVTGHTRPFKVTAIPPDMQLGGKGPLLSAYKYDRDMLWARMSQLHQLSTEEPVVFSVKVHGYNNGGLKTSVFGMEAFVPNVHICRRPGMTRDEAVEHLIGQEINVTILELEHFVNIKLSETYAHRLTASRPGTVVWGRIGNMTSYGAFMEVDGLDMDALLHNSCISSEQPEHPAEVFSVGERICAVVLESTGTKMRVSTKVLEQEYGEMLHSKAHVFGRTAAGPGIVALPDPADEALQQAQRGTQGHGERRHAGSRGAHGGMRGGHAGKWGSHVWEGSSEGRA